MNAYEQKQADRRARLEARADRADQQANQRLNTARTMGDAIPFGQPILVGHHSEGRDRKYRARITANYEKGFSLMDKAKNLRGRASRVGTGGISSDDPDAIAKLREQLANLERSQELMKAANAAIRRYSGNEAAQLSALVDLGMTEKQARETLKPDFCQRVGFPRYALSNNNANIQRVKQRIADLEKAREREPVELVGNGYTYREDVEDNRACFLFDAKPSEEIRKLLKSHAFKWSPSRPGQPWVRQLTGNAQWAAKMVRQALDEMAQQ